MLIGFRYQGNVYCLRHCDTVPEFTGCPSSFDRVPCNDGSCCPQPIMADGPVPGRVPRCDTCVADEVKSAYEQHKNGVNW